MSIPVLFFSLGAPLQASAFTLEIGSDLEGWDASVLPIHYNPTDCEGVDQARLEQAIDAAVALWNSIPTSSIRLERGSVSSSSASDFDATQPVITDSPVILCSRAFETDSGLGAGSADAIPAVVRAQAIGNRLSYAPMLLNAQTNASAAIVEFSQEQLTLIIAHELGHVLGLGHVGDPNSLMYYNVTGKTELRLSEDDRQGVSFLYPRREPFGAQAFGCGTLAIQNRGDGDEGSGGNSAAILEWVFLAGILAAMSGSWKRLRSWRPRRDFGRIAWPNKAPCRQP